MNRDDVIELAQKVFPGCEVEAGPKEDSSVAVYTNIDRVLHTRRTEVWVASGPRALHAAYAALAVLHTEKR